MTVRHAGRLLVSGRPRTRRAVTASALVFAILAIAACDDSGDGSRPRRSTTSSSSSSGSTSSSSTTTTTTVPPPIPTPPPTAAAVPSQCGTQTDAILAAIGATDLQGLDARAGQFSVQGCRLAASSPIWAAAETVANPGFAMPGYTVLLQRIGALWNVLAVGERGRTGCDAPAEVNAELNLGC